MQPEGGLPQESVLAHVLFNVYTSDLVEPNLKKNYYADDLATAYQFVYTKKDNDMAEKNNSLP